jgi:hypothetical protein
MANKILYVASIHNDFKTIYAGTLEDLLSQVFGYALKCGNTWNRKIPRFPKSGKSLVKALNDYANGCDKFEKFYELVTKEDFEDHDGDKYMLEAMKKIGVK